MSYLSGGTLLGPLRFTARTTPGLSPAGQGRIYFDSGTNKFVVSENGGAYVDLVAGAESLAATLAVGNTTGGTDLVISTGDEIIGEAELTLSATGANAISFSTSGAPRWSIDANGHFVAGTDDTYDIGATGATRPRRVYVGTEVVVGNTMTIDVDSVATSDVLSISSGDSWNLNLNSGYELNLTTKTWPDFDAGGISIRGGDITNGTNVNNVYPAWIDIQAGSTTGGEGHGGWIQIGAGNARNGGDGGFFQMWAGSAGFFSSDGDGGFFQINAGDGGSAGGSGGYLGLFAGDANGGTDDGGDVTIDAGSSSGGTAGAVDIGRTKASAVNIGGQNNATNFTSGSTQLGSASNANGLILVRPGFTSIADGSALAAGLEFGPLYYDTKNGQYVQFGNSIYIDGQNQIVRSGDGADVHVANSTEIAAANATFDLSTLGAVDADPLEPGTVEIRVILNNGTVFSTTTDDGSGNFPASAVLPAGGTVNYAARTLTGVTAGLRKYSRVQVAFANSNTAGEALTVRAGDGSGSAVAGGALTIRSGAGGTTSGNSGAVSLDAGAVTSGTAGTISVGTTNASALTIGRTGVTTTVAGTFAATGSVVLGAVATVSTNTTLNATNAIALVDANAGGITITLPTAASANGRHYTIKKIDSSANVVTVDGDGVETIDGAATVSLAAQYDSLEIVSNGTAWFIV